MSKASVISFICLAVLLAANAPSCSAKKGVCGKHLAELMKVVCVDGYSMHLKKRSGNPDEVLEADATDATDELDADQEALPYPYAQFPLMDPARAKQLRKDRRRRYGIVNECCVKSCSYFELVSYCV